MKSPFLKWVSFFLGVLASAPLLALFLPYWGHGQTLSQQVVSFGGLSLFCSLLGLDLANYEIESRIGDTSTETTFRLVRLLLVGAVANTVGIFCGWLMVNAVASTGKLDGGMVVGLGIGLGLGAYSVGFAGTLWLFRLRAAKGIAKDRHSAT